MLSTRLIFLNKLIKTGTDGVSSTDTVELTFRWVDGTDNNDIKLTAYITSASIGAATGDIVRAEGQLPRNWCSFHRLGLMSVYLGTFGEVELKRQFDGGSLQSTINTG